MATGLSACSLSRAATHSAASGRGCQAPISLPQRTCRCRRRRQHVQKAAGGYADLLHNLAPALADHLVLAYERVVYPCSSINCGDVLHRSTLDPVLRLEQRGIDPKTVVVAIMSLIYLTLRPGVLQGAWDYYILDRYQRLANTTPYNEESFLLGKKLAAGGFGTVYKADLIKDDEELQPVIVKKAKEFGEAEVWMNERLMRVAPASFAKFVTAFEEEKVVPKPGTQQTRQENLLWLVWQYEGNETLWDVMQKRDFPYNVEPLLLGRTLDIAKSHRRRLISIRLILRQVLEGLSACHDTGIVHRDVKPQNVIMSTVDNKAKLIDLGAAADLRVGINYVPSEFLLDPRYAPPQQYIMSTSTPRAPPLPVAALLSPILWRLNNPDRFDMFSVGILLLQMAFPSLRSDNNLIAFRRRLEQCNFDMLQWRRFFERRSPREASEGFELLDLNDGALWDLTLRLMAYNPSDRISASEALQHPAFGRSALSRAVRDVSNATGQALKAVGGNWVADALGGSARQGALTEAKLNDELGPNYNIPGPMRRARTTISWWQARQGALNRASADRKAKLERQLARTKSAGLNSSPPTAEEEQAAANGVPLNNGKPGSSPAKAKKKRNKLQLPWLSTTQ